MSNGIDLILADHRAVDELFTTFGRTLDGIYIGQVLDALTAHDDAEHAALYPLAGELLGDAALIDRMAAAHVAIKTQMEHVRAQEGTALVQSFEVLQGLVQAHVADEERKLLPALQKVASADQLELLGSRILVAKQRVG